MEYFLGCCEGSACLEPCGSAIGSGSQMAQAWPNVPVTPARPAWHGAVMGPHPQKPSWGGQASTSCCLLGSRKLVRRPRGHLCRARGELQVDSTAVDGIFQPGMERRMQGMCLLGAAMPAWHVLPVLMDLKIAADETLPELTGETLPFTTTAMFAGWCVSCLLAERALSIFTKEQLMVSHMVGMLLVALATVSLPSLTTHSLAVLTAVRFVQGLLLNGLTGIAQAYTLENATHSWRNSLIAFQSTAYSMVTILMACVCSGDMDWRSQELLWCGLPPMLVLLVFFPDWRQTLESMRLSASKGNKVKAEVAEAVDEAEWRKISALAFAFLTCGACCYGLDYSAGKLSEDPYTSTVLLHGVDILGYITVLSATHLGRRKLQYFAFIGAAMCLVLCSSGEPGSSFVLTFAMIGRLCLDVCLSTVYLLRTDLFKGSFQTDALATCEVAARVGGIVAPFCGTLPTTTFCPIFAGLCLASAYATTTLPSEGQESRQK